MKYISFLILLMTTWLLPISAAEQEQSYAIVEIFNNTPYTANIIFEQSRPYISHDQGYNTKFFDIPAGKLVTFEFPLVLFSDSDEARLLAMVSFDYPKATGFGYFGFKQKVFDFTSHVAYGEIIHTMPMPPPRYPRVPQPDMNWAFRN